MAVPSKDVLRAKRRASRERIRRRLHQKKASLKSKRPNPNSQLSKADPWTVHLVDGGSKQKRYLQFWHVFVGTGKAGRAWLSKPSAKMESGTAFITVEISEKWRGRGVGSLAFRLASEHSGLDVVKAEARKSNLASHRAMETAGFVRISDTAIGEAQFEWRKTRIRRDVPSSVYCGSLLQRPFPDHESESQNDGVLIRLHSSHGCRQDPKLREVAESKFRIPPDRLSAFNRITYSQGCTWGFSMVHSWALVTASWHAWRTGAIPGFCIHVDDHTDLGPCFGSVSDEEKMEANGLLFTLNSPANIREHLFRGSFNKGSFLIPWMARRTERTLYHLSWSGNLESFRATSVSQKGQVYLQIQNRESEPGHFSYRREKDLSSVTFRGEIWLDIDLDAFCNRFNGDSDLCRRKGTEKEFAEAMARIDSMIAQLKKGQLVKRIKLVTVATSPGFCPSDYWAPMLERISAELKAPPGAFSPNG